MFNFYWNIYFEYSYHDTNAAVSHLRLLYLSAKLHNSCIFAEALSATHDRRQNKIRKSSRYSSAIINVLKLARIRLESGNKCLIFRNFVLSIYLNYNLATLKSGLHMCISLLPNCAL